MEWDATLRRQAPPPIVPEVRHPADTRNFETVPDAPEEPATPILVDAARLAAIFSDF